MTDAAPDYSKPMEVSDLQIAFPASLGVLLPDYEQHDLATWERTDEAQPFVDFANKWFALGLGGDTQMSLKPDIDGNKMLRHLKTVMGSFEPKHEHKIAGVAWLLSQWCDWVKYAPPQERV